MVRVCFHIHSDRSHDSLLSLEEIAKEAKKNNFDVVILADHGNLVLPAEAEKISDLRIIVGEELKTTQGELIGIFLKEKIESGLSPEETIKKIKEQGGLVVAPHPFDIFRFVAIKKEFLLAHLDQIDVIEVFNARNILNSSNKKALNLAEEKNKVKIVGADAHSAKEMKNAWFEMEDFNGPADFLEKLKKAKFQTRAAGLLGYPAYFFNKFFKKKNEIKNI